MTKGLLVLAVVACVAATATATCVVNDFTWCVAPVGYTQGCAGSDLDGVAVSWNCSTSTTHAHLTICRATCNSGYYHTNGDGDLSRQCIRGTWTGRRPVCMYDCHPIPSLTAGTTECTGQARRAGDVCKQKCLRAPASFNNMYRTCEETTGWSGTQPVCERCGDGIRQVSEECDDGNLVETDSCNTRCMFTNGAAEISALQQSLVDALAHSRLTTDSLTAAYGSFYFNEQGGLMRRLAVPRFDIEQLTLLVPAANSTKLHVGSRSVVTLQQLGRLTMSELVSLNITLLRRDPTVWTSQTAYATGN